MTFYFRIKCWIHNRLEENYKFLFNKNFIVNFVSNKNVNICKHDCTTCLLIVLQTLCNYSVHYIKVEKIWNFEILTTKYKFGIYNLEKLPKN